MEIRRCDIKIDRQFDDKYVWISLAKRIFMGTESWRVKLRGLISVKEIDILGS